MSSLAAFANLDVDKLITDIAARPAIWDKNFNGRQNKGFLEDTWDELVSFDGGGNCVARKKRDESLKMLIPTSSLQFLLPFRR